MPGTFPFHIRPVQAGDGAGINRLRRMPGVFENTLGLPSERVAFNEEGVSGVNRNHHYLVAVEDVDGTELIIGAAFLSVYENPRKRHCGSIGIMVHTNYQGRGVGHNLMEALLDLADNWLMLVRVELTVYPDNERAIALYRKLGFEEEGLQRMSSIRHGAYVDDLMMARLRH